MPKLEIQLRGEFITLDAALKVSGLADSGGVAKALVASGVVQVDGQTELRKTCKLRAGQIVRIGNTTLAVVGN